MARRFSAPTHLRARHLTGLRSLTRRLPIVALAVLLAAFGLAAPQQAAADTNPASVLYEAYPSNDAHPDNGPANPRVLDVAINSPSTGSPVKWVRLLLPEGWSKTANRTWPTLWLLHGGGDDHTSYTNQTHIEEMVEDKDVIVVMPETSRCSTYVNWWNNGDEAAAPDWEDYLIDEVSDILETGYRASGERSVLGISMGGGGATSLAGKHPGHFQAVASLSGAVDMLYYDWAQDTNHDGKIDDADDNQQDLIYGPSIVKLGALTCGPLRTPIDWKRIGGEPGYPFYTNDPTDLRQQWFWKQNGSIHNAPGLAGTPLYVYYGNGSDRRTPTATTTGPEWTWQGDDTTPPLANRCTTPDWTAHDDIMVERGVYKMNENFTERLAELSIPATVCSSWGVHDWRYWEREIYAALPMLLGAINVT